MDSLQPNTSSSANIHPKLETPDLMDIGGDGDTTIAPSHPENDFFCAQKCVFCLCIMSATDKSMLLECLHPVCESCLRGQNNSADLDIGDTPKVCPACNVTSNPNKMLENKFLLEIASLQGETDKCRTHPNEIATDWCMDCRGYICEACVNAHKTLSYTQDHIIRSKEEMYQTKDQLPTDYTYICKSHPKEILNVFCNTCSMMTCRDCQLTTHKEHSHIFVKEFATTSKVQLTNVVNKLRYKTELAKAGIDQLEIKNRKVAEKKQEIKQQITKVLNELFAVVRKTADDMISELSEECERRKTAHDAKKKILTDFKEQATYCTDFVEQAVEMSSNTCLVYTKQLMVEHLSRLENFNCKIPIVDPNMRNAAFNRGLIPTPEYGVGMKLKQTMQMEEVKRMLANLFQLDLDSTSTAAYSVQQAAPVAYPPHSGHYPPQVQQQQAQQAASMQQARWSNWGQSAYSQQQQQHQLQQQHKQQQQHQQQTQHQVQHPQQLGLVMQGGSAGGGPQQQVTSSTHPQQATPPLLHQQSRQHHQQPMGPVYQTQVRSHPAGTSQHHYYYPTGPPPPAQAPPPYQSQGNTHLKNLLGVDPSMKHNFDTTKFRALINKALLLKYLKSNKNYNQQDLTRSPTTGNSRQQQQQHHAALQSQRLAAQMQQSINQRSGGGGLPPVTISPVRGPQQQQQPPVHNPPPASVPSWHIPQKEPTASMRAPPSQPSTSQDLGPSYKIVLPSKTPPAPVLSPVIQQRATPPSVVDTFTSGETSEMFELLKKSLEKEDESVNKDDKLVTSTNQAPTPEGQAPTPEAPTPDGSVPTPTQQEPQTSQQEGSEWQKDDPNEDWCAVCMDGGDLVCCDSCPKVFHTTCHIPQLAQTPPQDEPWQCLLCRTLPCLSGLGEKRAQDLTVQQHTILERILLELYCQFDQSLHFREAIPPENKDYHSVIKKPMCFDYIRRRLSPDSYNPYRSARQVIRHIRLVFKNAFQFNDVGSQIYKDAMNLEEFLECLLTKYLPDFAHTDLSDSSSEDEGEPHIKRFKRIKDG